jgi:peptidoglycan/xylan/chitin deacetylase (PgdA/CDA1 family)
MRSLVCILFWLAGGLTCAAQPCPDNPNALGTSRVLTISPAEFNRIGSLNYKQVLPLEDHEVVITFDDGPIPPYSNVILDTLASQCVKATYFLVGQMARSHPSIVRRIYNAGHSIGSHSQDHPFRFQRLSMDAVEREVDDGIASIDTALGDPKALSPFFRIPGFGRTNAIDDYLASKSLVTWSTDVVADDWKRIGAREIVRRAIQRLEKKHRGILLLHDIHPATVLALPMLLKELKDRGYHVVHVVASGDRPDSVPETSATTDSPKEWPRVTEASSRPSVATPQHHHVKKNRHKKRHADERI